eukprot:5326605-Lingulodinium_polyedra.AAC.1
MTVSCCSWPREEVLDQGNAGERNETKSSIELSMSWVVGRGAEFRYRVTGRGANWPRVSRAKRSHDV